jgi:TonB family protein
MDPDKILISQPTALGRVATSVRAIMEDWRSPRSGVVNPVDVQGLWEVRRYKAQVWSFAGYAAMIGVVALAGPRTPTGAAESETIIELADTTKELFSPYFPPAPVDQVREIPQDNASSTAEGAGAPRVRPPEMAPPEKPSDDGGGGGGGRQETTDASKGNLPQVTDIQLTTPLPAALNLSPEIAAPPTLVARDAQRMRVDLPAPSEIGIPLGAEAPPSSGRGRGGGIGDDGDGRGIGNGRGAGFDEGCCSGTGGGRGNSIPATAGNNPGNGNRPGGSAVRGAITEPEVIRKTKPPYSEDARRNKIQGTVILDLVVQADGSIDNKNIRIVKGQGHGLDESAINDIQTWTFKPATENGRPIARTVRIEVNFALR